MGNVCYPQVSKQAKGCNAKKKKKKNNQITKQITKQVSQQVVVVENQKPDVHDKYKQDVNNARISMIESKRKQTVRDNEQIDKLKQKLQDLKQLQSPSQKELFSIRRLEREIQAKEKVIDERQSTIEKIQNQRMLK